LVVNSGCWQKQTEYMRRLGFVPTPGLVPVVNLQTLGVKTLSFI
jgi:DNA polymerase II small subunit/DNA polymerase delta subunit B